jgi:hypothetical protein
MFICGVALAALPWLSTKYAPMAAAVAAVTAGRLYTMASLPGRERAGRATLLIAPLLMSVAGWFLFFYSIWGTVSPSAPYGGSTTTTIRFALSGLPGLLLDQEYGVVMYAPILLASLAGVWAMWRAGGPARRLAVELTVIFSALLATVGAFHIWWGGSAVPGRPIASGLLLFGIPLAWRHARATPARRAADWLLLLATAAVTAVVLLVQRGLLTANGRDGSSRLLEWLSPDWPLWAVFPSFIIQRPAAAFALTAIWVLVTAVWWKAVRRAFRTGGAGPDLSAAGRTGCAMLVTALGAFTVMSFVGPPLRAVPTALAGLDSRPRSVLLDRYDAAKRPVAIVYDPFRTIPAASVPPLFQFVARPEPGRRPTPVPLLFNARFALPAGTYRIDVESLASLSGSFAVQLGRDGPPAMTWAAEGRSPSYELELGVDVNFVGFRTSPGLETSVRAVRIRPLAVVDHHLRQAPGEVLGVFQQPGATLYFYDRNVWVEPEGFWTRGASTTLVTVVPRAGRVLPLRVRCGPRANTLTLATDDWRTVETVRAGTEKRIAMPYASGRTTALRLTTEDGFTPAAVEPNNRDRRFLGCRVEIYNP